MNLFTKQKDSQISKTKLYGYRRGNVGERDKLEAWD